MQMNFRLELQATSFQYPLPCISPHHWVESNRLEEGCPSAQCKKSSGEPSTHDQPEMLSKIWNLNTLGFSITKQIN